jgi:hypothetical protein
MKLRFLLLLACLMVLTSSARADHDLVFISAVVKIDDTDCAIELTISGNNQDAFVAADSIQVDGDVLVTLENLIEDGINQSGSNNDSGDKILVGSVSFEDEQDIAADLVFSDSECASLDNANVVGYYIDEDDDGAAENEIDTVAISDFSDFDADSALTKTSASATPELEDLTETSVTLTNNAGDEVEIEAAAAAASGLILTNCALDPHAGAPGSGAMRGLLAVFLLTAIILKTAASRADTVRRD